MGMMEIIAFFRSLPEIARVLGQIVNALEQLKRDAINREMESIKSEVDGAIQKLILSKTDDQRKAALLALANSLRR